MTDSREPVLDSPARARALVHRARRDLFGAALVDPRSSWLSLMCSYWRARFVPFFTPRGGITTSYESTVGLLPRYPPVRNMNDRVIGRLRAVARRTARPFAETAAGEKVLVRHLFVLLFCEGTKALGHLYPKVVVTVSTLCV